MTIQQYDLATVTDEDLDECLQWLYGPARSDQDQEKSGMNQKQATELYDYIMMDLGPDAASLYQVASGDWVVRLKARDYWLWSFGDWTAYRKTLAHSQPAAVAS